MFFVRGADNDLLFIQKTGGAVALILSAQPFFRLKYKNQNG